MTIANELMDDLNIVDEDDLLEEADLKAAAEKMVAVVKKKAKDPSKVRADLANVFMSNMQKMIDGEIG